MQVERGGVPLPIGKDTKLQRMDVISVVGLKYAVSDVGATASAGLHARARRPTC